MSNNNDIVDSLQLFVVRHGERVDNVFGSNWLDKCFIHYSSTANNKQQQHDINTYNSSHSIYQRYDLNLPKQLAHRLPIRPLQDYEHDTPITELGVWQASNVGEALQGSRIQYVFCSPALRCVQTAHALINAMGLCDNNKQHNKNNNNTYTQSNAIINHTNDNTNTYNSNSHNNSHNNNSDNNDNEYRFNGICIEPALYEWTGWLGDYTHKWLTPQQLYNNGLYVNINHKPLSSVPESDESQYDYYKRNSNLVDKIIHKYGSQGINRGNILIVGHMPSLDVCTYKLLTGDIAPNRLEIEMGARQWLYSNYCGVARIRYNKQPNKWTIQDDQQYQQRNSQNETFSFYNGWNSQHKYKDKVMKYTKIPELQSLSQYNEKNRIPTLHFRRSFGFILDSAHNSTQWLLQQYSNNNNHIDNKILDQYIRKQLNEIETQIVILLPEWQTMSSYHEGYTARHTYRCFITTNLILGYASEHKYLYQLDKIQQNIFSWSILLHDLAKQVYLDDSGYIIRDSPHPFKSAIIAANILARYGFSHTQTDSKYFDEWKNLVMKSLKKRNIHNDNDDRLIHNNNNLSDILKGIDYLFGSNTICNMIVKIVLLHQSIDFLPAYPPGAPLNDYEIMQYITDTTLLHMLCIFTMIDSASYTLSNYDLTKQNMNTIYNIGQKYKLMMNERDKNKKHKS